MDDVIYALKEIKEYFTERFDRIEDKLDKISRNKSILDGDELMDNQDLCTFLGVTKRTVQRYRYLKLIPFYKIDKIVYYKKSDVIKFFQTHNQRKKDKTDE